MRLQKAILVDIDGTLADITHRVHYVNSESGKRDWKSFNALVHRDKLKKEVAAVVDYLYASGVTVILVTGRFNALANETIKWLHKNNIRFNAIFMRPDGDYRSDHIVKEQIYKESIMGQFDVLGVFEDRDRVVDMWRNLGLTCFQVQKGDY